MAHHTDDTGDTYVDSDFVNDAQRVPGVELRHIGFGEFVFTTPKGEAEVDRMRGVDFEGQKGRSHKLYDDRHGSGAAEWLVSEVEKHNLSRRVAGLRSAVIRLAHMRPDLRPHLLPLLKSAGTTLPGIPAVVTKVRGRMAFVVPVDPASAPSEIAKGDWFRVLLPVVGEEGKLIPPTSGAKHQDWLFAPYRMNEDYRGEPRVAGATKKYIVPVIALSNEMHEKYTGQPVGTRLKVWIDADPDEPRLFLDIERTYGGYLDKFMESEIPEDIGISNEKEVREAIRKWIASPLWKAKGPKGHTWDFTSRHAKTAGSADARVWYVGGGKYVVNVNGSDLQELQQVFPQSTKRVSRSSGSVGMNSIYTTERGSNLIKAWLQEHGRTVGGSPQWDLAPGEMPSW